MGENYDITMSNARTVFLIWGDVTTSTVECRDIMGNQIGLGAIDLKLTKVRLKP